MNNRESFEAWANTHGGLDLTVHEAMDNEKLSFPCTYYNYTTEIAWRAFANKKVPAQAALAQENVNEQSQAQQESQWISVMDCDLKNNDTIYAHRFDGEVVEAVYRFWKDHKNPHRILSNEFGHESINKYKNVMTRKVIPIPPAPEGGKK